MVQVYTMEYINFISIFPKHFNPVGLLQWVIMLMSYLMCRSLIHVYHNIMDIETNSMQATLDTYCYSLITTCMVTQFTIPYLKRQNCQNRARQKARCKCYSIPKLTRVWECDYRLIECQLHLIRHLLIQ